MDIDFVSAMLPPFACSGVATSLTRQFSIERIAW